METTNDIINWITQSGAVLWLFYFAFVIAKPFVDGKIKHAKTAQQREAWTLLEQVAMTTVNSLVSAARSLMKLPHRLRPTSAITVSTWTWALSSQQFKRLTRSHH